MPHSNDDPITLCCLGRMRFTASMFAPLHYSMYTKRFDLSFEGRINAPNKPASFSDEICVCPQDTLHPLFFFFRGTLKSGHSISLFKTSGPFPWKTRRTHKDNRKEAAQTKKKKEKGLHKKILGQLLLLLSFSFFLSLHSCNRLPTIIFKMPFYLL